MTGYVKRNEPLAPDNQMDEQQGNEWAQLHGPGSDGRIIKNPHCQTVEDAWLVHKQKAAELGAQGLTVRNLSSFADYVEIEKMKLGMVAEA